MQTTSLIRLPVLAAFACAGVPGAVVAAPGDPVPVPVPGPLDITVDVDVGEPMMIAGQENTAYIKITLGGFALPQKQRSPINLTLVLDTRLALAKPFGRHIEALLDVPYVCRSAMDMVATKPEKQGP